MKSGERLLLVEDVPSKMLDEGFQWMCWLACVASLKQRSGVKMSLVGLRSLQMLVLWMIERHVWRWRKGSVKHRLVSAMVSCFV
jgi:hypothetical protein